MSTSAPPDTPILTPAQAQATKALQGASKLLLLMPTLEDCRRTVLEALPADEDEDWTPAVWIVPKDGQAEIIQINGTRSGPASFALMDAKALAGLKDAIREEEHLTLIVEDAGVALGNDDDFAKLVRSIATHAERVWGYGPEIRVHSDRPERDPFLGLEPRDAQCYDVLQDLNAPCTPSRDSMMLYMASLGFTQARRDLVVDIDLTPLTTSEKEAVRPFCPDFVTCTAHPPCSDPSAAGCARAECGKIP